MDNAARNDVANRIVMRGAASATALDADIRHADGTPVVLCDIDGPEIEVIDPEQAPSLARAVLLIEVHGPDICRVMEQRPDGGAILAAVAEGDADVVLLNGLTAHARSVFSSPR